MSDFSPEDFQSTFSPIRRSMELWPDPFDSPEVPAVALLRAYSEGGDIDPDIRAHIDESVDCQRAIAHLLQEDGEDRKAEISAMQAALLQAAVDHPVPVAVSDQEDPPRNRAEPDVQPRAGELFATPTKVEQWNGGRLVPGFTFRPMDVLILDDGHTVSFGDTVYRGVACSPADLWPTELRADDESVADFGHLGEFVIHWWLNYPVSRSQLGRKIGSMQSQQSDEPIIPEDFQPAGPDPDPRNEELWLERDRLHACAAYLGANAHARRLAAEEEVSGGKRVEKFIPVAVLLDFEQPLPRAAASEERLLSGLAIVSEDDLDRALAKEAEAVKEESPGREEGYAEVVTRPTRDRGRPDHGFIQWGIHPEVFNARQVLVVDRRNGGELGRASLSKNGGTVTLKDVPWSLLQPYSEDPARLRDIVVAVVTDA